MKILSKTPQRLFGSNESAPKEEAENQKNFNETDFTDKHYREVWQELTEAIGEKNYYNGRVVTLHEGFTSTLRTTLIIYRDEVDCEERIVRIIPIWWEMETITDEGKNSQNNFSLHELLKLVGEE